MPKKYMVGKNWLVRSVMQTQFLMIKIFFLLLVWKMGALLRMETYALLPGR